jgi:uncharacterized protein (DUF1501 family)
MTPPLVVTTPTPARDAAPGATSACERAPQVLADDRAPEGTPRGTRLPDGLHAGVGTPAQAMSHGPRPPASARRHWLRGALAASLLAPLTGVRAASLPEASTGRLVVVFLRGACDGLSALVPWSDREYPALRPTIAIPPPDGTADTALALDARFALHPALAPLLPLWREGRLAAIPAAGSPHPTRSHFEAQHHWETGLPGHSTEAPGWLNRLVAADAPASTRVRLIGVGEANPGILAGSARARLVQRGEGAARPGVLADERVREALADLYGGDDRLGRAFREGMASRLDTARELARERMVADNGAAPTATGLALDARHLATLMRSDPSLRVGFLSAGGWDTHANQGAARGLLANNFAGLARALGQLRSDFDRPDDFIVVLSEFGRTAAENGSRGTDHGRGNAMWLIGARVAGGRAHGRWEGLAPDRLNEGRDLPVLHDFRAVLAQVLARGLDLPETRLADVFPGARWEDTLDGLVRRA